MLLGSTAFDSFSAMPQWRNFVDAHADSVPFGGVLIRTVGLLVFVGVVERRSGWPRAPPAGSTREQRRACPVEMAHSLIPIVIGYVFAHYLTYLVERGQQTLIGLADPFGRGWLG